MGDASIVTEMSRAVDLSSPTEEEVAAIAAAVDALWPRAVIAEAVPAASRAAMWRFSGRWWVRPLPVRRDRPYH